MTSQMIQREDNINHLYSCLNDIVTFFYDNTKPIYDMIIKLYTQVYSEYITMLINNSVNNVIDDVTVSKIMSVFGGAVTSLIFLIIKRERWSKAQM